MTGTLAPAIFSMSRQIFSIAGLAVMIRAMGERGGAVLSRRFSSSSRCRFRPRSMIVRSTAISTGFSLKS